MGLAEIQVALARLATEAGPRAGFSNDPVGTGIALGLDEADARSLARLSVTELERFAVSLVSKRRQDVEKVLVLTRQTLGPRFSELFRLDALARGPRPGAGILADAEAFAASLARVGNVRPPWIGELARYEVAQCVAARRRFLVRHLRYDVARWVRNLALQGDGTDPPRRSTLVMWIRVPRLGCLLFTF
jgi:hypothetical protein